MLLFLSLWCCLLNSHWMAWVFLSAGDTACCCSWSQQTLSPPMVPSPGNFPPGSQISLAPIFRMPLWQSFVLAVSQHLVPMPAFALIWGSLYSMLTLCSPLCGSTLSSPSPPHGGILFMHPALPFRSPHGSASSLCLPPYTSVSCPCPASPYAQGSNASCSAVMALSASPASLMLEALSACAGVASTLAALPLVHAHQGESLTPSTSTFSAT